MFSYIFFLCAAASISITFNLPTDEIWISSKSELALHHVDLQSDYVLLLPLQLQLEVGYHLLLLLHLLLQKLQLLPKHRILVEKIVH
jgi:hypothetical protein